MKKNNFTSRVFLPFFLLLSLLPYACNNDFFEDHPCCTEARKALKSALSADSVKIKAIEVAKEKLDAEKLNFIEKLGIYNAFLRAYLNGPSNSTTRTQQRTLFLAARNSLVTALGTYVTKSTDRWLTMVNVNSAQVTLATCIRANCPPIDSCCPSEKTAEHAAILAKELQLFRIANYTDFIAKYNEQLAIIIASINALTEFDKTNCDKQNRQQCIDLGDEVFLHTSDKNPFIDARKPLLELLELAEVIRAQREGDLIKATKAKTDCEKGCPK
jgi:hypothetical protein